MCLLEMATSPVARLSPALLCVSRASDAPLLSAALSSPLPPLLSSTSVSLSLLPSLVAKDGWITSAEDGWVTLVDWVNTSSLWLLSEIQSGKKYQRKRYLRLVTNEDSISEQSGINSAKYWK